MMDVVLTVLGVGFYAVFGACLFCAWLLAFVRNEQRNKERDEWR